MSCTVYTTCLSCRAELTVELDGQTHHDSCPPPPPHEYDQLLAQFEQMLTKIATPDYQPTKHEELNFDALRLKLQALEDAPPRLGDAAVIYAQWGWPVFPLRPQTKVPATRHGFKDASTDVDRIRRYWNANPHANIGIPTGHAFDVIDVDLPDGPASWEQMRVSPGAPDIHGQVRTASGGLHAFITPTGESNGAKLRPGIDYRGAGGYVVAPPSWLGSSRRWKWITKPSPRITNGGGFSRSTHQPIGHGPTTDQRKARG